MPYINFRWLGGMLTNFQTVHARVAKLRELQRVVDSGEIDQMPKKEGLKVRRDLAKLDRNLGGIKNLEKLPAAVFVIDTKKEHIAVTEANRLKIPVVAVVDTNCDPDIIDYVIPGNDDAIRAAQLMSRVIADAVIEGKHIAQRATPARAHRRRRAGSRAGRAGRVRSAPRRRSARTRSSRPRRATPPRRSSVRSRNVPVRRRRQPATATTPDARRNRRRRRTRAGARRATAAESRPS